MSDERTENGMSGYAPNYEVGEGESPFRPLPMLELCSRCRDSVPNFSLRSVAAGHRWATGLCPTCADALNRAWSVHMVPPGAVTAVVANGRVVGYEEVQQ